MLVAYNGVQWLKQQITTMCNVTTWIQYQICGVIVSVRTCIEHKVGDFFSLVNTVTIKREESHWHWHAHGAQISLS